MKTFFETKAKTSIDENGVYLLGMPFDGTSCFRKGANLGPSALREISDSLEDYSFYQDRSLLDRPIFDLGDFPESDEFMAMVGKVDDLLKDVDLSQNKRLFTLGGEHSISYAPIKNYLTQFNDLYIVHLDAHADLRDGYQGFHYSHASVLYRVQELMSEKQELLQFGIRSGLREEFQWMKERNTLAINKEVFLERLEKIPANRPIYLTLDLDFFDPAYVPGTGTPEAGGEDFKTFIDMIQILKEKNFVGADMVELAPNLDPTGNSACFAAKVVREILLALQLST